MSLRRPTVTVTVDGHTLDAAQAAIAELLVELGIGAALDRVTATLSAHSPLIDSASGAALTVAMGYGDDVDDVFTGVVTDTRRTPWGVVLDALTDACVLTTVRIGRAYLDQTAADVATDLIASGGARVGRIDAAVDLPVYHVDERRSAWRNLCDLARLTGSTLRSAADGSIDLTPPRTGVPDHRLRCGAELLGWGTGEAGSLPDAPAVAPSGAGSEAGATRWQLLLAEPDGGPPSRPTLVPSAIRTRDAARAVEDALAAARTRCARRGTLVAVGLPAVRGGDLVDVTDLPHGADAAWRVLDARHVLDRGGLRSRLLLEAA